MRFPQGVQEIGELEQKIVERERCVKITLSFSLEMTIVTCCRTSDE